MLGLHPHHVARVLPSNCKATSHCAAFSQALMAALHAMVSWPWRVRWSNEKVMGNWTIKKKSDLQAPRCLVVTWEMAPSCCWHFHAPHLGEDLQSTAPFPSLFASTSVDVHERWWPVRFELLVTFLFPTLQLCGPAEPSWNVWNKVETCPCSALRLECWTSMADLAPRASHVAELTQLK